MTTPVDAGTERGGVRGPRVEAETAHLQRVLRTHGLRRTTHRVAVVELLAAQDQPGHLTAAEVHARLAAAGHDLDASTVYRVLATLVELRILHATGHADGATSYGIATHSHHHALCSRCGRLGEIPAQPLSEVLDQAAQASRYQLADDSLLLHGVCPSCQQETARA